MSIFDGLKRRFGSESSNGAGEPQGEMISCTDALALVHEYLDGELEDVSAEQVRAHFDVCGKCYPHLKLEESFRQAVRSATEGQQASPELKSRVMELLAEAGKEE